MTAPCRCEIHEAHAAAFRFAGLVYYFGGVYVLLRPAPVFLMSTEQPKTIYSYDALQVGDTYSTTRFISEADVRAFAEVTGDDNPIHIDEEYARHSRFGHRVVHGVLLLGIISKVLGRDFPGHGSIAVSLSCRFLRPVPVNSDITVEFKVTEKLDKYKHVKGRTYVYYNNKMVLAGEAIMIPPAGGDDPAAG